MSDYDTVRAEAATPEQVARFAATQIDEESFYGYLDADLGKLDGAFIELFDRSQCIVVPPIVYTGGSVFKMTVLGEKSSLGTLLEQIPSAFEIEVDRISEHRGCWGSHVGRLTARQFAALEAAASVGYFSAPRGGSLSEVATELNCSESVASTLVRTTVANLVDATLPDS